MNETTLLAVIWVATLAIAFTLGGLVGSATTTNTKRDLFMSYCTGHGDAYETCSNKWNEK